MYGIKSIHDSSSRDDGAEDENEEEEEEDIETAIQKELAAMNSKPGTTTGTNDNTTEGGGDNDNNSNRMTPVKMNVDCLLFVKTHPPVDPVAFVRRICEDAKRCEEIPGLMRCRYVNRLTPVSVMGKATEAGLVEVAREVLGGLFDLSGKRAGGGEGGGVGGEGKEGEEEKPEAAKTEAGETGEEENAEKKPFTVSLVLFSVPILASDTDAAPVRHPADHPQPQQLEARRGDQHGCWPDQRRSP
jgi:tRNA acetyltransferase TAN1